MVKTTKTNNKQKEYLGTMEKSKREIRHAKNVSEATEKGIIRLYNELVPADGIRPIDIQMIMTEAFPKFEETIGKEAFDKVKRYFGIEGKSNPRYANEIRCLVTKLRTIENAQYYIVGYKEMVKKMAEKLCNAPEDMNEVTKVKILRMFFIIFHNNEIFLEDYVSKTLANGKKIIVFSEEKALSNNKLTFGPEEMFDIFHMKVKHSEGYFYDMMVLPFKRMVLDYQTSKNKYKNELIEIQEFAELKYNSETGEFSSVNKCMSGATFAKIRRLKQRVHQVQGAYALEIFCNKKVIEEKIDITDLYVIYKTLCICPWKTEFNTKKQACKTMCGSKFIDKQQTFYEIFDNFLVADDAEAERWISLFEYVAKHEFVLSTKYNGNGEPLSETKFYNAGVLSAVLNYAMDMGYINVKTMAITDFEVADKLLALEGAQDKFLKLKRCELKVEQMRELLGIDEEFENNVLQINKIKEVLEEQDAVETETVEEPVEEVKYEVSNSLVQSVIKFALDNGYAESEEKINLTLIENVFIPGNEENIKKFSNGEINNSDFKRRIGFEAEFAEAYFNTSKFNVKAVEAKLQELKRCGKKEQVRKSKLLVALYCYIIKNGIGCGPKNKPAKRNKGLKPEILEKLIS